MGEVQTATHASGSPYRWEVVGLLWFVCLLNYADRQAIFSVFPLIKTQLQLSDLQLGVVGSAFMWMYALMGPFAGSLCDRLPRKGLILGALVFWSLITAATAVTHSFTQLVICRALGGLGEAFYFPAAMSMLSDYHGPSTRSRAMSIHQSSVYAGTIFGGALSGTIGQHHGWRASFLFWGAAGVILSGVLLLLLREPERGSSEAVSMTPLQGESEAMPTNGFWRNALKLLSNVRVITLIGVFIAANFVAVVFLTWMPSFLFSKFRMSLAMAGFSGTAYLQAASVCGVLGGGVLADALRRKSVGGRQLAQSFGLLCGVPFLLLTGWTTRIPILIVALAGFGLFKGIYDANIFAGLYDIVPVRQRGSAAGLLNSFGWLGGGSASVLIAVAAKHWGLGACISATGVIYLAAAVVLLLSARMISRSPKGSWFTRCLEPASPLPQFSDKSKA